jgi:RNA polymerase sigma factor (sigma-70 family)
VIEAELIRAAQRGERDALIQLLREIETPLYRTAYYLLGNEQDALDATQDALIRIYSNIGSYREEAQFKTWTQRIITNLCIDRFRKRKDIVSIDEHDLPLRSAKTVEDEVVLSGLADDIQQAINQLPEHFRTVVVMRYIQDFSYNEISELLDIPLNTVKSHLFRARKLLQGLLREYEEGGVRG